MFISLYQQIFMVAGWFFCCLVSVSAMESYEENQEKLRKETFIFIEHYVNARCDQSSMRMIIPARLFQYIPEKIPPLPPKALCLINRSTINEIATAIGINKFIEEFLVNYSAFKKKDLNIKRMDVSNYLYACVFEDEREFIVLREKTKINEEKADEIAKFLNIKL